MRPLAPSRHLAPSRPPSRRPPAPRAGRSSRVLAAAALLAVAAAVVVAPPPASAGPPPGDVRIGEDAVTVPDGTGGALVVERDPFRLVLVDADGDEVVATLAGLEGPPVRVPGVDGPQPIEPLGPAGASPGLGFVVGTAPGLTFPIAVPFFTGNRLFGAEVGVVTTVVRVAEVTPTTAGAELALELDAPGVGPAAATLTALPDGGVSIHVTPPDDLPTVVSTVVTFDSPPDEALYGLGGRKDAFDQRGLLRNVWVEQQNVGAGPFAPITDNDPSGTTGPTYTFPNGAQATHYPQALLFGSRGWGAWARETVLQRLDLAASVDGHVRWASASPHLDLVLFGGGLEEASRAFTAAEGRAPAPPRYAYEPWISVLNEGEGEAAPYGAQFEGGPRVRADVEEAARMAEALDLPIGVIGMEGWHEVPDVEELNADLRARGFRLAAYWSPFVNENAPVYEEAVREGYLVRDATGQPYPIVTTRGFVNHLVDFTNPDARAWWGQQLAWMFDLGFEAFMNDFGELVTEGMVFHSGEPPSVVHNRYPLLYHRAVREGVDRYTAANPEVEPFFFVRAGASGTAADPGVTAWTPSAFPGDETTDDDEGFGLPAIVPAMLNLALGGSYAFTTDVGGYLDLLTERTTPELFVRWHQAATFMPINRVHNSTFGGSFFPWELEGELLDTYRRFAKLKVALIDLVDDWSQRAATDGVIGPVRPLVLDDPSPAARGVGDQWLLGRDLLVAPILHLDTASRDVYLPAGADWQRVEVTDDGRLRPTGEQHAGGTTVTADADLATTPLYVRVGGTEVLPLVGAAPDAGRRSEEAPGPGPQQPASPDRRPLPVTGGPWAVLALLALAAGASLRRR